jgi:PadR family transcriptional regulator, regulatory protein PadR
LILFRTAIAQLQPLSLVKGYYQGYLGNGRMTKGPLKTPNALLHGALDALILKTLARGPSHGYAIARYIEDTTGDTVLIEDGSLYPALYRLERKGLLEAEWGTSELGRRAKVYRITGEGRAQLAAEMATWKAFAAGVSKVLFSS